MKTGLECAFSGLPYVFAVDDYISYTGADDFRVFKDCFQIFL